MKLSWCCDMNAIQPRVTLEQVKEMARGGKEGGREVGLMLAGA